MERKTTKMRGFIYPSIVHGPSGHVTNRWLHATPKLTKQSISTRHRVTNLQASPRHYDENDTTTNGEDGWGMRQPGVRDQMSLESSPRYAFFSFFLLFSTLLTNNSYWTTCGSGTTTMATTNIAHQQQHQDVFKNDPKWPLRHVESPPVATLAAAGGLSRY